LLTHPSAEELQNILELHVIDAWFPRCIDTEYGGYLCDFDRAWSSTGPHYKLIEFQARQLLFAAEAFRLFPQDGRLGAAIDHGLRYLREVMWDHDSGGWFHLLDRSGLPLEEQTKHVHGAAYAIQACCAVYETLGDADALMHARAGFDWMERYARDNRNGGYFGFLQRDGTVICDRSQWHMETDPIGTLIGLKDINIHCDLLETLTCLYQVWPDATVEERLRETIDLFCSRLFAAPADLHFYYQPDWTPIPRIINYGYQFQAVFRLLLARGQLTGTDDEHIVSVARSLMDRALVRAHDARNGGYFAYAEPGDTPRWLRHIAKLAKTKPWWVQTEILKAALALSRVESTVPGYIRCFQEQCKYFSDRFLDQRYGGSFRFDGDGFLGLKTITLPALRPRSDLYKGDVWKDASHDGRAWIYCINSLRD